MHIPDNYLSPASCAVLAVAAAPVIVLSIKKVKVQLKENKELAPMLGIAASLSFLLMMFNVPVPGGTTAHAVGGTLLAILIGPYAASLALTVALLLQAFLFGDGGILALGANIFNMAIVMPFVGYAIYNLFRKHHQETLGVIIGSFLSINAAAFLAGVELGLQPLIASEAGQPLYNPYGLSITVPAMLGAHLLVAGWVEAFFTVVIYRFVKQVAPAELYTPSTVNTTSFVKKIRWVLLALIVLSPLGLGQLLVNGLLKNWVACFMAKSQQGSKMDSLLKPCSVITPFLEQKLRLAISYQPLQLFSFSISSVKSFDQ